MFNGVKYLIEHSSTHGRCLRAQRRRGGRIDGKTGGYLSTGSGGRKAFTRTYARKSNEAAPFTPADNAIYKIAPALAKIEAFEFAVESNSTTRGYFTKFGEIVGGDEGADMKAFAASGDAAAAARLKRDPSVNGAMRTTCVATMINGGHAPNALPQHVTATVNCRIFPGHQPEEIRQTLIKTIGDTGVNVVFRDEPEKAGPPPELTADIMDPIENLTQQFFPGVPVVPRNQPARLTGAFSPWPACDLWSFWNFPRTRNNECHGLNERIRCGPWEGREFLSGRQDVPGAN